MTLQNLEIQSYAQHFRAKPSIETARELKVILETVAKFTDEGLDMWFNENGILIQFMDQSGAIFVKTEIDKAAFESYQTSGSLVLNFNPTTLAKILSTARDEERIVFSYPALKSDGFDFGLDENSTEDDVARFGISFDNGFKERLYDVPQQQQTDSDVSDVAERAMSIEMATSVTFEGNVLIKNVVDMKIQAHKADDPFNIRILIDDSEKVQLALADNSLERATNVKLVLRKNDSDDCKIKDIEWDESVDPQSSTYGFEYLVFLEKLDQIAESFKFAFSKDGPFRVTLEKENFVYKMLGAPLETEDDFDEPEPEPEPENTDESKE